MFLVEEPQLIKVNFKPDKSDFANDNYYKQLYIGEISWCRKNTEITLTIHTPLLKCTPCQGHSVLELSKFWTVSFRKFPMFIQ